MLLQLAETSAFPETSLRDRICA